MQLVLPDGLEENLDAALVAALQRVKVTDSLRMTSLVTSVIQELGTLGVVKVPPSLRPNDLDGRFADTAIGKRIASGIVELVTRGVLVPCMTQGDQLSWHFLNLTTFGERWLQQPLTVSPGAATYIDSLCGLVAGLDTVVEQYIGEAALTFRQGALFASSVMLGVASERLIYILAQSIVDSAQRQNDKEPIQSVIDAKRSLRLLQERVFERVRKLEESGSLPYSVAEGAGSQLQALFDSIRLHRNDSVHPQNAKVSRDALWLSLMAFPAACKKVYHLNAWFGANRT